MKYRNNFPFGKDVVHAKGTWGTYLYAAFVKEGIEKRVSFKIGKRTIKGETFRSDVLYIDGKKIFTFREHESVYSILEHLRKRKIIK
jgi:hypothetical protein